MGFFVYLAMLNLAIVVVCGARMSPQGHILCDHWCLNPDTPMDSPKSYMCCEDIKRDNDSAVVCDPKCLNGGECTEAKMCKCNQEWTGNFCQTPVCDPECRFGALCVTNGNGSPPYGPYCFGGQCIDYGIIGFYCYNDGLWCLSNENIAPNCICPPGGTGKGCQTNERYQQLECPKEPRIQGTKGGCANIPLGYHSGTYAGYQEARVTCSTDSECGTGNKCCSDACLGPTCKVAVPVFN